MVGLWLAGTLVVAAAGETIAAAVACAVRVRARAVFVGTGTPLRSACRAVAVATMIARLDGLMSLLSCKRKEMATPIAAAASAVAIAAIASNGSRQSRPEPESSATPPSYLLRRHKGRGKLRRDTVVWR